MPEIQIRNAVPGDIPDIVSLYNLANQNGDISFDAKIVSKIFEKLDKQTDYHFYVAEIDKRVVGTFMLLLRDEPREGEGVVENIAVHKKFRRRGVGRKMITFAIGQCRDAGNSGLVFVASERMPDANEFLESIGFHRHGYRYIHDLTS